MIDSSTLEGIGLTKGEARVYLALVHLGSTSVGPIITLSKVSGSKVYVILNKLIQKGLVSSIIRNKTKIFQPQDPSRLFDYIDNQEKEIQKRREKIGDLMPSLIASLKEKPETIVEVLEGKSGFISIHEKELKKMQNGDTYYSIADYTFGKTYAAFWIKYNELRQKKGIGQHLIYSFDNWNQKHRVGLRKKRKLFSPRVLPTEINIPTHLSIFKEAVVISIFEKEPISIVIRNKSLFNAQKQYFKMLWDIAKLPMGYEN
ncbi:hypothetical protein HOC35_02195 [Candidatus Woesearchaeota archaeon]|nr:hypothetical protein [Candidatus Woesearchaeota archaeon]